MKAAGRRFFFCAGAVGAAGLAGWGSRFSVCSRTICERELQRPRFASRPTGRFNLYEFDLRVGVAEFGEFGLEQRVIARVVHQAEVIGKFRIEANRENVFVERNRIGVHEITSRERTDAANGFNQLGPQPGQVAVTADVSRRIYCRRLDI